MGHTRHAVLSRLPVIRFRFALWLPPRRGEENPLQGTMAQRLTSAESPRRTASRQTQKDCAKQQFYAVFVICCKKQGVATDGWVRLQPIDAWQPWVCFRLQPIDALQPPVVFPLQLMDALQPLVVFGIFGKKEGMVKPSLLIFNQRFRADERGYVYGFAPRNPAPAGRFP